MRESRKGEEGGWLRKKLSFFIEEINKKRSNLNIMNDKYNLIINIDETLIFYDSHLVIH